MTVPVISVLVFIALYLLHDAVGNVLLPPSHRQGNQNSERLSDSPDTTQLIIVIHLQIA